jgi:hypothetical protein
MPRGWYLEAGRKYRHSRARCRAAEALLHLFVLPPRDAHTHMLPAAEKLRKQKAAPGYGSFFSIKQPNR